MMLSRALIIVTNELEKYFTETYGSGTVSPQVRLGHIAEGVGNSASANGAVPRDILDLSMVSIWEKKTLNNLPNQTRNDARLRVVYENSPVFLANPLPLTFGNAGGSRNRPGAS